MLTKEKKINEAQIYLIVSDIKITLIKEKEMKVLKGKSSQKVLDLVFQKLRDYL